MRRQGIVMGGRDGFTLTEVLVASAMVAVGLAGVLVSFSVLTRTARLLDTRTRAMHEGRKTLEELQGISFSAPELAPGVHSISGGQYEVSTYGFPSTKTVAVSFDVLTPNGTTSRVSLTTVMSSVFHK